MKQLQAIIFICIGLISHLPQADFSGSIPAINYLLISESTKVILYDEFDSDNGWVFNSVLTGGATASAAVEGGNMNITWFAQNHQPESTRVEATLPITVDPEPFDYLNITFSIVDARNSIEPYFGPSGSYSVSYGGIQFKCCLLYSNFLTPERNYPFTVTYKYDKKHDRLSIFENGQFIRTVSDGLYSLANNNYIGPSEFKITGGLGYPFNGAAPDSGFAKVGHIYIEAVVE